MCRKTILGPTFGSPLHKISILPKLDDNSNEEYIYFMTTDKIDLQHLPLTGNPYDQMAIIAHPNRVSDVRASYDGQHLFTSSGLNNVVNMLRVNPQVFISTSTISEDINHFDRREVTQKISLSEIPFVMRALAFGLNPADLNQAFNGLSDQLNPDNNQPQITRENLLFLLQQYGEHMNDYEMADCLGNLLHLHNESTEMFDTMNVEDACQFIGNPFPE
ncbi:unnamed protein product [Rotaria sp. Silwood1]|nr:unnamed protein product [Rotaria sp. Silwood1]